MHASGGSRSWRRATTAVVASLIVLGGCSVIEGDEESEAPPSTIVAPQVVDAAQLEAILPQPADFGPEFVLGESEIWSGSEGDEPDDDFDLAFERAVSEDCPVMRTAVEAPTEGADATHSAERAFAAPDGRAFEISVGSGEGLVADAVERAAVEEMLEEVALCPTSQIVDAETGLKLNVTFDGRTVDTVGEWGGELSVTMAMSHQNLPQPVVLKISYLFFGVGSVAAAISSADGFDQSTMRVTPADLDRRDAVAEILAMTIAAIQMAEPTEPTAPAAGEPPAPTAP